jgi:hypothetical protein
MAGAFYLTIPPKSGSIFSYKTIPKQDEAFLSTQAVL